MVACYGRALHVLSENWPVLDGDEPVGPIRAMNEASRVVAEHQVREITGGRLSVDDLDPETAMALTLFGIWGLGEFPYHEALNLSKSLNIPLVNKPSGYRVEGRMIGLNPTGPGGRSRRADAESTGFHAPLVGKGSKLRLARPEERNETPSGRPPDRLGRPPGPDHGPPARRSPRGPAVSHQARRGPPGAHPGPPQGLGRGIGRP